MYHNSEKNRNNMFLCTIFKLEIAFFTKVIQYFKIAQCKVHTNTSKQCNNILANVSVFIKFLTLTHFITLVQIFVYKINNI